VTPVNWEVGDEVIVAPVIPDEDAQVRFPLGFRTVTGYLRYTPQPGREAGSGRREESRSR
jgi:hypothetical protein